MASAVFIEGGTAATQGFQQWASTTQSSTGTVTSDAQAVSGSVRSIASANGATPTTPTAYCTSRTWTGLAQGAHAFHMRWNQQPTDGTEFVRYLSGGTQSLMIFAGTGGVLKLVDSPFAVTLDTGTTSIAANTDARVLVLWDITSTITFRIRVYVNGTLDMDVTHGGTLASRTIDAVALGIQGGSQAGTTIYFAHNVVFDSYFYGEDIGDVRVTCKRPDANGDSNGFTTQIGAGGSGYGAGHSPQVNERPLSNTNGWSLNTAAAVTEEYGIEAAATGDVDISGKQIIDILGWLRAKTTTSTRTCQIIVNGVSTAISVTTTEAWYEKLAGVAAYPSGVGNDIGMTSQAASDTYSLYEAGVQVAYYQSGATLAVSGTATATINEGDIVTGGKTGIATLANDAWLPASFVADIGIVGAMSGNFAGTVSAQDITYALTGGLGADAASTPAAGDLVIIGYGIGSTVQRFPVIRDTGGTDYPNDHANLTRSDNFDHSFRVMSKVMGGTPDTQFRLTETVGGGTGNIADGGAYYVIVLRRCASTFLDVAVVTAGAISSSTVNPGSITPTTAGALLVIIGGAASATGSNYTASYLTDFRATFATDTNDSSIGGGYRFWTTGAYDGANFGNVPAGTTANSWNSITMAIRPLTQTPYDDSRAGQVAGYDSAQAEAAGFDARKATILPVSAFTRTSGTVSTAVMVADAGYNITAQETLTVSVGAGVTLRGLALVGTPTFTIDPSGAAATSMLPSGGQPEHIRQLLARRY